MVEPSSLDAPWVAFDPWVDDPALNAIREDSAVASNEDGQPAQDPVSIAVDAASRSAAAVAAAQFSPRLSAIERAQEIPPRSWRRDIDKESSWSFELYRIHSVAFELTEGDTLVFIDFPSPPREAKRHADCHGIAYGSQQFRVHAEKLLATGSSKFADMLNPTYQFRIQRRRKMVNKLPEGVKYLLDLTPPSEGDDLVFQMTELSLTPGIMDWWTASKLHGADQWLVTGHDDICSCQRAVPEHQTLQDSPNNPAKLSAERPGPAEEPGAAEDTLKLRTLPATPQTLLQMKDRGENQVCQKPAYRQIPDYCSIRHRNSIIRLLMVIEGQNIILDSASRVWTMVALAKIFDCAFVLRDQVAQWVMHVQNTKFIEVLPEEALQIGFALELPQVTQSAFRILVNELALKEAATNEAHRQLSQTTIFGRRVSDPGDELSNLIQHAARALVDRISASIQELRNPEMLDYWNVPEWNRLRAIEQLLVQDETPCFRDALASLRRLMEAVAHQITSRFDEVALAAPVNGDVVYASVDQDLASYVEPKNFKLVEDILKSMNLTQQLLLSFIYNQLMVKWDLDFYSTDMKSKHDSSRGRSFEDLVFDVGYSLQLIVEQNPALRQSAAWAICFDQKERKGIFLGTPHPIKLPIIDLRALDEQVKAALRPFAFSWVRHDIVPALNITRHLLLTLNQNELKYLPLWAGGCNDGTGGVFEAFLPPAEMGPNGPGPAYHTGITVPSASSSISGSLMDEIIAMRIKGSTTAGSVDVEDSLSTVYRHDYVIAGSESIASEAFTSNESEYQVAQFDQPAEHQGIGQALDMLVESATDHESSTDNGTVITDQETTTDGDSERERAVRTPTLSLGDSDSDDGMVVVQ